MQFEAPWDCVVCRCYDGGRGAFLLAGAGLQAVPRLPQHGVEAHWCHTRGYVVCALLIPRARHMCQLLDASILCYWEGCRAPKWKPMLDVP